MPTGGSLKLPGLKEIQTMDMTERLSLFYTLCGVGGDEWWTEAEDYSVLQINLLNSLLIHWACNAGPYIWKM